MDALAFQYVYDYRNRISRKKLPGRQPEYIAYDIRDQIIATGPALSPFGNEQEGWLRTKYDFLGRPVYTLWQQGAVNENTYENIINTHGTHVTEKRTSSPTTVNGITLGYTNLVQPTSGYDILTINYYDNYIWPEMDPEIPSEVCDDESEVFYNIKNPPTGLPTGNWVRIPDPQLSGDGKLSFTLYDYKARPVRNHTSYPDNGYTTVDSRYNFPGAVLKTVTLHKKSKTASEIKLTEVFEYTDQMRLLSHTHQINSLTPQLLSRNSYDVLGQLSQKKTGGTDASGSAALQLVDYKYNIRGWLTDINNVNNLNQPGGGPVELFAFKKHYDTVEDDINGQVKELYNGNIAETFWRTATDNVKRKYGYSYDGLNRITAAYYQVPGTVAPRKDSYSTSYSYDSNGNLLTLKRNGEADGVMPVITIDDLEYSYDNGNRLQNVRDREGHPAGYNDRHFDAQIPDFGYDDFGNMISDMDKEIEEITYNHLNLPVRISFSNGGEISYIYDASGIKFSKEVNDNGTITTTTYLDGFQYTKDILDFFPHAEGYVKVLPLERTSYSFQYVFNHSDHLGNIRVRYTKHPETGAVEILEENHYYPFGLTHKGYNGNHKMFLLDPTETITLVPVTPGLLDGYKYKFGGKEYQDELGLDWYDYGARNYQADLGRFFNIDRYAESFMPISTYQYAANNPITYIDHNGDYITIGIQDDEGNQIYSVLYEDGKAYHYKQDSKGNITKGGEYDGNSSFVEKAVGDLNKIAGTKQGGRIVGKLQSSSEGYSISNSRNPLTNSYDSQTNSINYSQDAVGLRDGVYFNKSHIKLGHEIAHACDDDRGFDMQSTVMGGLPASEVNAVRFENYLRAMSGETTMRTLYSHPSSRHPYNLKSAIGGTSANFFKSYIAPLGRDEIYKRMFPVNVTNPRVDKTYVKKPVNYGVYNTREQKFVSF